MPQETTIWRSLNLIQPVTAILLMAASGMGIPVLPARYWVATIRIELSDGIEMRLAYVDYRFE